MSVETIQLRIHGDASLPTLIYLPGLHGDWTLVASFRAAVKDKVRFVEFTYPRTVVWSLEEKGGQTVKTYEKKPQPPYQRLLASEAIPEASKASLREEHQRLDPFALKTSIEGKLKKFFTALGNLDRESMKT